MASAELLGEGAVVDCQRRPGWRSRHRKLPPASTPSGQAAGDCQARQRGRHAGCETEKIRNAGVPATWLRAICHPGGRGGDRHAVGEGQLPECRVQRDRLRSGEKTVGSEGDRAAVLSGRRRRRSLLAGRRGRRPEIATTGSPDVVHDQTRGLAAVLVSADVEPRADRPDGRSAGRRYTPGRGVPASIAGLFDAGGPRSEGRPAVVLQGAEHRGSPLSRCPTGRHRRRRSGCSSR